MSVDDTLRESWSVRSVLATLFQALNRRGVAYVALRFDETLLQPDTELDLLVKPAALTALLREIRELCGRFPGLRVAYWRELPRHAATIILAWRERDGSYRHYFFDIRCGIRKRGIVIFDGAALEPRLTIREPSVGARCLREDVERALLLIRNALDRRAHNRRHMTILERGSPAATVAAMRRLGFRAGRSDLASLWGALVPAAVPRVVWATTRYGARALIGRTRPRALGMNVILYGPDGVGKSTQAALLGEFFRSAGVRRVGVYHSFVEAGIVHEHGAGRVQKAKRSVYRGASQSRALTAIVLASYVKKVMQIVFVFRRRARRGHVAVHDRYLLDVFQKAWKSVGARFPGLERVLPMITPQEQFVFVLDADPDTVSARTSELDPDQVKQSYHALFEALEASRTSSKATHIDANQAIQSVHRDLVAAVLEIQTRRCLMMG